MPRSLVLLVGPPHPCNLLANRLVTRGVNTVHKADLARAAEWLDAAGRADALLLVGADETERDAALTLLEWDGRKPPPVWQCGLEPLEAEVKALVQRLGERPNE